MGGRVRRVGKGVNTLLKK